MALATAACAGTGTVAGGKELSGQVWFQELSGSLAGRNGAMSGTATVAPKENAAPGFSVTVKTFGSLCFDLSYVPLEVKTTFDSATAFAIGGVTFGAVSGGTLDYRMSIVEPGLRWIALDNKWFRLCTSANLKIASTDIKLNTPTTSYRFDHTVPIPMAGVSGQVNFTNNLKAYGSMKFLDFSLGSLSTTVHDWELGAIFDWTPKGLHTFRAAGGYRKLSVDLFSDRGQSDESSIGVRHQGPFAELATSF
jgi:hypothetical protein